MDKSYLKKSRRDTRFVAVYSKRMLTASTASSKEDFWLLVARYCAWMFHEQLASIF